MTYDTIKTVSVPMAGLKVLPPTSRKSWLGRPLYNAVQAFKKDHDLHCTVEFHRANGGADFRYLAEQRQTAIDRRANGYGDYVEYNLGKGKGCDECPHFLGCVTHQTVPIQCEQCGAVRIWYRGADISCPEPVGSLLRNKDIDSYASSSVGNTALDRPEHKDKPCCTLGGTHGLEEWCCIDKVITRSLKRQLGGGRERMDESLRVQNTRFWIDLLWLAAPKALFDHWKSVLEMDPGSVAKAQLSTRLRDAGKQANLDQEYGGAFFKTSELAKLMFAPDVVPEMKDVQAMMQERFVENARMWCNQVFRQIVGYKAHMLNVEVRKKGETACLARIECP